MQRHGGENSRGLERRALWSVRGGQSGAKARVVNQALEATKGSLAFILRVCGAAVEGHRGEYWLDCSRNFCLAAVGEGDRRGARVDVGR